MIILVLIKTVKFRHFALANILTGNFVLQNKKDYPPNKEKKEREEKKLQPYPNTIETSLQKV